MIEVVITKNRVCLQGHAGYAELGKDIVCAAASVLWYAVTEKLEKDKVDFRMHEESGYAELVIQKPNDTTETVLDTMKCGIKLLEENYPGKIFLKKY